MGDQCLNRCSLGELCKTSLVNLFCQPVDMHPCVRQGDLDGGRTDCPLLLQHYTQALKSAS
jgi:hypothetical protein